MSMKIKLNEDTVKFKVWYKWFGEKGYEYVYADGPYEAEYKFIEKERYKDHPKELLRVETPGTIITRKKESKQDEADYSTSRVSKPIADAYSLLDGYFCDEDGRLTNDAVDKIYLTFRNERDLYDRSKSRAVKSHSLAWSALIRQINATLEWDDENPHATSLTSEQVKNWFKLKGRDYKEELKPLVAVIDAYRNKEY